MMLSSQLDLRSGTIRGQGCGGGVTSVRCPHTATYFLTRNFHLRQKDEMWFQCKLGNGETDHGNAVNVLCASIALQQVTPCRPQRFPLLLFHSIGLGEGQPWWLKKCFILKKKIHCLVFGLHFFTSTIFHLISPPNFYFQQCQGIETEY